MVLSKIIIICRQCLDIKATMMSWYDILF